MNARYSDIIFQKYLRRKAKLINIVLAAIFRIIFVTT